MSTHGKQARAPATPPPPLTHSLACLGARGKLGKVLGALAGEEGQRRLPGWNPRTPSSAGLGGTPPGAVGRWVYCLARGWQQAGQPAPPTCNSPSIHWGGGRKASAHLVGGRHVSQMRQLSQFADNNKKRRRSHPGPGPPGHPTQQPPSLVRTVWEGKWPRCGQWAESLQVAPSLAGHLTRDSPTCPCPTLASRRLSPNLLFKQSTGHLSLN